MELNHAVTHVGHAKVVRTGGVIRLLRGKDVETCRYIHAKNVPAIPDLLCL